MGNLLSRVKLALRALHELDAEYRAVEARLQRSPGLPVPHPTQSFWTIPRAPIADARPDKFPHHADAVIVGSGIAGTAVAWTLLRAAPGLRVVMLEARDVCNGATGRNGGHINPPLFHDYAELKQEHGAATAQQIVRFRLAHLGALKGVAADVGVLDDALIKDVEGLDVYFERDKFERACTALEAWRADMPEEARASFVVEGAEALEKFGLAPQAVGCIVTPAASVHPYRLVTSILAYLLEEYSDNFILSTHTPCTAIASATGATPHYTLDTPRGPITTPHVIHTTNGWSGHLLPALRTKILPVRGAMSAQRPGLGLPRAAAGTRAHIFYTGPLGYDYLTQRPDGARELLFGGGAAQGGRGVLPAVGCADDGGWEMAVAARLAGALPEYFGRARWGREGVPAAGEEAAGVWEMGRVKRLWTGVLGVSADGMPWAGRLPVRIAGRPAPGGNGAGMRVGEKRLDGAGAPAGEWIAAGFSGEGMVHAWLCGRAVGCMVLGPEAEREARLGEWFPDVYRVSEARWKRATLERLMERF